jgi:hypothetical protein
MNPKTKILEGIDESFAATYADLYGADHSGHVDSARRVVRVALDLIERSDALYHDLHHTAQVTLASQPILRGWHRAESIGPDVWLHVSAAAALHDIGMVRGACRRDTDTSVIADHDGRRITPPRGASDAFLTPYHVDRGMIFVRERASELPEFDVERLARCIDMTRFPIPDTPRYNQPGTEASAVRGADLVGQLGDSNYLAKMTALYHEFVETGTAAALGYRDAADLVEAYPRFFRSSVEPYIQDSLHWLELTSEGRQWLSALRSNVSDVEAGRRHPGPQRRAAAGAVGD